MSSKKKLTAADAIAEATCSARITTPSKAALEELKRICEYNDTTTGTNKRVSAETAVKVLNGFGWNGKTYRALNVICQSALGRRSYARP